MDKIWLTKLVVLMGKLQFMIFTKYILQWHLHIIVMHSLLYRKRLLQDFFNFHWLWLLRFLLDPTIWFYWCSCWFCASIISALKNSAPPDVADRFLESCTSIVFALKKSAQHAQKCTDWFHLQHYASIHMHHFSSYKVCLPDPKGAGLNPYMICAQLQQCSLSIRAQLLQSVVLYSLQDNKDTWFSTVGFPT